MGPHPGGGPPGGGPRGHQRGHGEEPPPEQLFIYDLVSSGHRHRSNLGLDLSWGRLTVTNRRLGQPHQLIYAALHPGGHEFVAQVAYDPGDWDPASLEKPVEPLLRMLDQRAIKELMAKSLGARPSPWATCSWRAAAPWPRRCSRAPWLARFDLARNLYETHRDTMRFLQGINVPRPKLFEALASAVLAGELIQMLTGDPRSLSPGRLGEVVAQARELGLDLKGPGCAGPPRRRSAPRWPPWPPTPRRPNPWSGPGPSWTWPGP